MSTLFDEPEVFDGLPPEGFAVFEIERRDRRRKAIIETFHPALESLGRILARSLRRVSHEPFHVHLPRLDWPRGYEPFCTWVALSHETQGYQQGPQLNVGVHPKHVSIRLGWDTNTASFSRFEFFCRHGGWTTDLAPVLRRPGFRLRVYASAPWPRGSTRVFESGGDVRGSLEAVRRGGLWWEIGERLELPGAAPLVGSSALARRAEAAFLALAPLYNRMTEGLPENTEDGDLS